MQAAVPVLQFFAAFGAAFEMFLELPAQVRLDFAVKILHAVFWFRMVHNANRSFPKIIACSRSVSGSWLLTSDL